MRKSKNRRPKRSKHMKMACALLGITLAALIGCGDQEVDEPLPIRSNHPDQVLLDRAIQSLDRERYAEASTLLETLLISYPDSPLVPGIRSALDQCGHDPQCPVLTEYRCGGLTFFPDFPGNALQEAEASDPQSPQSREDAGEIEKNCHFFKD